MQVRAGFLRKRPADGKPGRVHRRYMVLYEDRISWYVGAGDRNPLGDLMLSESTLVDRELSATADALHVHTRERKLTLLHDVGTAANGGGSLDAWACAVQDCVDAIAARFPAQYSLHSGRASAQCSLQSGAEPTVTSHSMTSQHARARGASEQDAELQRAIVESLLPAPPSAVTPATHPARHEGPSASCAAPASHSAATACTPAWSESSLGSLSLAQDVEVVEGNLSLVDECLQAAETGSISKDVLADVLEQVCFAVAAPWLLPSPLRPSRPRAPTDALA